MSTSPCLSQASCYQQALNIQNMLTNPSIYSPYQFPLTGTNLVLNVTGYLMFYKLFSLGNDRVLSTLMDLDLQWIDPNIPGNFSSMPTNHNMMMMPSNLVWTMNLYLMNPAGSSVYLSPIPVVYLRQYKVPNITVTQTMINSFDSQCDTMDLTYFPFDNQTCNMTLLYKDEYFTQVNFVPPFAVTFSADPADDEWWINNVTIQAASSWPNGSNGISIIMQFTRKSLYYVIFLITPVILLNSVSILTVVLPSDRGEKVILGATLVVAMFVLISSLNQTIPQVQQGQTPQVVNALQWGFFMTTISVFEAVAIQTLRIFSFYFRPDLYVNMFVAIGRFFGSFRISNSRRRASKAVIAPDKNDGNKQIGDGIFRLHVKNLWHEKKHSFDETREEGAAEPAENSRGFDAEPEAKGSHSHLEMSYLSIIANILMEEEKEKRKKEAKKSIWRNIEYFLNFIIFLVYVGLMTYIFGFYIFST